MIEAKKEDIPLFNRKKGDFPIENLNGYGSQYCKPKFLMGKYLRIAVYTIRKWIHQRAVYTLCLKYKMSYELICKIIYQERSFRSKVVSHRQAKGMMQLLDDTFMEVNKHYKKNWESVDIFSPKVNVEAGILYLKQLIAYFNRKVGPESALDFALAAYNFGIGHIQVAELFKRGPKI